MLREPSVMKRSAIVTRRFLLAGLTIFIAACTAAQNSKPTPSVRMIVDPILADDFHLHQLAGPKHKEGYVELWTFGDSTIVEVEFQPHYHTNARAILAEGECRPGSIHKVAELRVVPPDPDSPQWAAKVDLSVNQLLNQRYSAVLYDRESGALTWCGEIARSNQMPQPTLAP